jgi:fluoroacetyl-CoA thioesterase
MTRSTQIIVPYHNETLKPVLAGRALAGGRRLRPRQAALTRKSRRPPLDMTAEWSLDQLVGYLTTWSGLKAAERAGQNLLPAVAERSPRLWGDPARAQHRALALVPAARPRGHAGMSTLVPGLRHTLTITRRRHADRAGGVSRRPSFGAMPPVFATAFMIGLMELACVEALEACLKPRGAECRHACRRQPLRRDARGHDGHRRGHARSGRGPQAVVPRRGARPGGVIGEGRHQRAIIERTRFMTGVARKARMVA